MTRTHSALLAAALIAGVAVAGCKKQEEPATETTMPPAAIFLSVAPSAGER